MSPATRIRKKLSIIKEILEEVTEETKTLVNDLTIVKEVEKSGRETVTGKGG